MPIKQVSNEADQLILWILWLVRIIVALDGLSYIT
jgi:hypothetical protein